MVIRKWSKISKVIIIFIIQKLILISNFVRNLYDDLWKWYKESMNQNDKLLKNIIMFKEQNSDLKQLIKQVDDEEHDPRSWLVGLQKIITKKKNLWDCFSEILESWKLKYPANNSELDKLFKFKDELNRFFIYIKAFAEFPTENFANNWRMNNHSNKRDLLELVDYFKHEKINIK